MKLIRSLIALLTLITSALGSEAVESDEIPLYAHPAISQYPAFPTARSSSSEDLGVPITRTSSHSSYYIELQVGTEILKCDIDTGSLDLVVQHDAYHPTGPDAVDLHRNDTLGYGYGNSGFEVKAKICQDKIRLGSYSGINTARRLQGRHSMKVSAQDGLVGLGPGIFYNDTLDPGFLPALRKHTTWQGVFTMDLHKKGGRMGLKMPSIERLKRLVWLHTETNHGFWTVGGHLSGIPFKGWLDTGTFQIGMPLEDFKTIHQRYPHLRVLTFEETGRSFFYGKCHWSPKDLAFQFQHQGRSVNLAFDSESFWSYGRDVDDPSYCFSSLVGERGAEKGRPWLLGNVLFMMSYIVFDSNEGCVAIGHKPK